MNTVVKNRYKKLINYKVNSDFRDKLVTTSLAQSDELTLTENVDLLKRLYDIHIEMDRILIREAKLEVDHPIYSKSREEILLTVSEIKIKSGKMLKKNNYHGNSTR
tara:strand:+ start:1086 stop:1403 length:318 start_codon:yes stop_codon:yes gene_type:complete